MQHRPRHTVITCAHACPAPARSSLPHSSRSPCSPTAARADDACHPAPLTSTCINDDTFWPHAGPQRFIGVGGTETTAEDKIGFGLVTDYLSRPIILKSPSPGPKAATSTRSTTR